MQKSEGPVKAESQKMGNVSFKDLFLHESGIILTNRSDYTDSEGVFCFPKYIPVSRKVSDEQLFRYSVREDGFRVSRYGKNYVIVIESIRTAQNVFGERIPDSLVYSGKYGRVVPLFPPDKITRLDPTKKTREIMENGKTALEEDVSRLVSAISEHSGLPYDSIGITNSILFGIETFDSDIDFTAYGTGEMRKVMEAWPETQRLDFVQPYEGRFLERLIDRRVPHCKISRDGIAKNEKNVVQALITSSDANVGYRHFRVEGIRTGNKSEKMVPIGEVVVSATISEDGESIISPSRYGLENVRILECIGRPNLMNAREYIRRENIFEICNSMKAAEIRELYGTKIAHARKSGDDVIIRGMLERVHDGDDEYFRVSQYDWGNPDFFIKSEE